jgi:hypothetical protein
MILSVQKPQRDSAVVQHEAGTFGDRLGDSIKRSTDF